MHEIMCGVTEYVGLGIQAYAEILGVCTMALMYRIVGQDGSKNAQSVFQLKCSEGICKKILVLYTLTVK